MAEPVRIDVSNGRDARDLLETLARHGLIGDLVDSADGWAIEVRSEREGTRRLVRDLESAVRRWTGERPSPAVVVRVGSAADIDGGATEATETRGR